MDGPLNPFAFGLEEKEGRSGQSVGVCVVNHPHSCARVFCWPQIRLWRSHCLAATACIQSLQPVRQHSNCCSRLWPPDSTALAQTTSIALASVRDGGRLRFRPIDRSDSVWAHRAGTGAAIESSEGSVAQWTAGARSRSSLSSARLCLVVGLGGTFLDFVVGAWERGSLPPSSSWAMSVRPATPVFFIRICLGHRFVKGVLS